MKGTVLGFYSMLLGCAATYGQQDITSIYLANPSFEEDATACTQDSPDAIYEATKTAGDGNLSPQKDGKPPAWKSTSHQQGMCHGQRFRQNGSSDGEFATTNVSVGAVQIRKCGKPHPHPCRPENTN